MGEYKELVNSAAKWGLILGVVMGASRIFETETLVSGGLSEYLLLTLEWFAAMFAYLLIIFLANRQRAAKSSPEVGYTFRETMNYSVLVSLFAAFIVAVSSHIYITNSIGGYANFAEATTASLNAIIDEAGVEMASNTELLRQSEKAIEDVAKNPPTIFTALVSSVANYVMAGLLSSMVIYWFVRRKRRDMFDNNNVNNVE